MALGAGVVIMGRLSPAHPPNASPTKKFREVQIASLITLLLAGVLLVLRLRTLRGTTLVGPWCWLATSVAALTLVAIVKWFVPPIGAIGIYEFLAASLTVCPIVAVLGAKRPQHRAWQFVVATLWIVIIVPAADAVVFGRLAVDVHVVRRSFLAVLIGLTSANYIATRFGGSALLYAVAQVLMLADIFLPADSWRGVRFFDIGCCLFALSIALVCLAIPIRHYATKELSATWLRFRDAYGAAWALRVADRINQASKKLGWNLRLAWSGFKSSGEQSFEPAVHPSAERSFRMLLRRFLTDSWWRC
jgi:hypothetical protein